MTSSWDAGIVTRTDLITAPTDLPVELDFVRDQHLRVTNGSAEDAWIDRAIRAAVRLGENYTQRSWMPQRRARAMDRFPAWEIMLAYPPIIEVESVTYVDADGVTMTLDGSPSVYDTSLPVGPKAGPGRVVPGYSTVWPYGRCQLDAVTVTYRSGYVEGSPEQAAVPDDLVHGLLLIVGEMYKQRSESVMGNGVTVTPAIQRARNLWDHYRVF